MRTVKGWKMGKGELSGRCGDDRRVVQVTASERGPAYISVHLCNIRQLPATTATTSRGEQLCVGQVSR
ncbi:hypothetical protein E2C01_076508 [Portunus trituberculatus]|uniref:Uncharacterized protein n=1 Tax=Portunus trituberculatus TaxID=210409 RepID=A0A5B7IBR1_PORTR|nr:hypothetical protein [Portunus trituberculatus]